jgi:hypothetical protein
MQRHSTSDLRGYGDQRGLFLTPRKKMQGQEKETPVHSRVGGLESIPVKPRNPVNPEPLRTAHAAGGEG